MAAEKTWFDTYLKRNMWKDLAFRAAIWVFIALLAAYNALNVSSVSIKEYLGSANNLIPLVNILGTVAIALGLIALMFKDMESLDEKRWGQDVALGRIGGLFRRLAGDLTLWTIGVLVTLLVVVTVAGFNSSFSFKNPSDITGLAIFSILYILYVAMTILVATLNVYVRREESSPIAFKFKNPKYILIGYIVVILCLPLYLWVMNANSA